MKSFIKKVVLFSLPVLLIAVLMEIYIRSIPNEFTVKKDYMDRNAAQIETLILGNSHTLNGINPAYLDSRAYNLAFAGQPLKYDLQLLLHYDKQLINLKNIIIPISYFSLYNNLESSPTSKFRIKYYKINFGLLQNEDILYNLEMTSVKLPQNISTIKKHWSGSSEEDEVLPGRLEEYLGWATRDQTIEKIDTEGKERVGVHEKGYIRSSELESNIRYISNIIAFAERHKCNVYFITTPHYASYYQNITTGSMTQTKHIMDSICSQTYTTAVRYIDMFQDNRFIKSDFVNSDHLNTKGAEKLTQILNKQL